MACLLAVLWALLVALSRASLAQGTQTPHHLVAAARQACTLAAPVDVGPLVYHDVIVDDNNIGQSVGNGDGVVNPGETIELYVELLNDGAQEAADVQASLSTNDPHVSFLNNSSSAYGNIPSGGMAANSDDFDLEVSSSAPHGHAIHFELAITSGDGGAWSDSFDLLVVGTGPIPEVALISDRTELTEIAPILDGMELGYDVLNDNWDGVHGVYTGDYAFSQLYPVAVWYASGEGEGRLLSQREHDALEQYVQTGGRLLVTGRNTLGSPSDPLMASLVRSSLYGDGPATHDVWITHGDHPIVAGPYGSFPTGSGFTAAGSDHDLVEAAEERGAMALAELAGGRDKILVTELASGGAVVYWNGNQNGADWVRGQAWSMAGMQEEETIVLDFDDGAKPCTLSETVALRDEYMGDGVLFGGPGEQDGGAVVDECGNYGVAGHSPPNFLAFDGDSILVDGGQAAGPAIIRLVGTASTVQVMAGSGRPESIGRPLTMEALSARGALLGRDTVLLEPALQPLSVSAAGIAQVVISSLAPSFVLDDVSLRPDGGGPGLAMLKNMLYWLSGGTVAGDLYEPNDTAGTCKPIFFDMPLSDPTIDPPGDEDVYCFAGSQGQSIAAAVRSVATGSPLDPALVLLDRDAATVLASGGPSAGADAYLEHTLPEDGLYYLRVRSSGHPCCGGLDHTYEIWIEDTSSAVLSPFYDSMESGVRGWLVDGLWHKVQVGSSVYGQSLSPTRSWWYGQDYRGDYDSGQASRGSLTSPPVSIPAGARVQLRFWQRYETEPMWVPQRIYFDAYHDSDGDDNVEDGLYLSWAQALRKAGYTIDQYNQPIEPAALDDYQALALFDPEIGLTPDEIQAVDGFMQRGGRVVALGEWNDLEGVNTVLNSLSTPHGISFNADVVRDETDNDGQEVFPLISSFARHPAVFRMSTVALYGTCSLSVSGAAVPLAAGDIDSFVQTRPEGATGSLDEGAVAARVGGGAEEMFPWAPVVMAYAPVGAGGLLAIGDSDLWTDVDFDMDGKIAFDEYDNGLLPYWAFADYVDDAQWDEKWVQISQNGGAFQDVIQVTGGPWAVWHESAIDLSPYAGSTIRIRFHFDTLDARHNGFRGWYVDDVRIGGYRVYLPVSRRRE